MSDKRIEDVISSVLTGDTQKNALEFIAHIRAIGDAENFSITAHDESGFVISNMGYMMVNGSDDFPGPWTIWVEANNLGEHSKTPADENIKEFAWSHVSPCGSCGGKCSPGTSTKIFGKVFENVCQNYLMFTNPNTDAVDYMKKIADIRKNDIVMGKGGLT